MARLVRSACDRGSKKMFAKVYYIGLPWDESEKMMIYNLRTAFSLSRTMHFNDNSNRTTGE
jgi:hypothetical protein